MLIESGNFKTQVNSFCGTLLCYFKMFHYRPKSLSQMTSLVRIRPTNSPSSCFPKETGNYPRTWTNRATVCSWGLPSYSSSSSSRGTSPSHLSRADKRPKGFKCQNSNRNPAPLAINKQLLITFPMNTKRIEFLPKHF